MLERRFVPVQHRESITLPGELVNDTRKFLEDGENYLVKERQAAPIPANQPLALTIGDENSRTPMMIYRSHGGLLARHLKTGAVLWANPIEWTIDRMGLGGLLSKGSQKTVVQQWLTQYVQSRQNPEVMFSNSVVGTLSSDSKRVFTVVDLEIPPPGMQGMGNPFDGSMGNNGFGPDISDALLYNRTEAYSLASGKLLWVAGGRGPAAGELADSHFLGPPLPVGDRLYQLNEKQQELRLVILDPASGSLLGLQRLCTTRTRLQADPARKIQAAHLAYADGILVCPTNAGVVLGIELLGNSFVWAYPYAASPEPSADPSGQAMMPLPNGRVIIRGGRMIGMNQRPLALGGWKVTPPVVSGGKVVFAAPDADAIHCVSLRDGSRLWSHKRQDDDLYLGGAVAGKAIVVGRKAVRALELDGAGKVAWTLSTGLPSGFGTASDNQYFLPLREAGSGKEPEVCVIDVAKGEISAHTRSRKKSLPGNLVFHDGDMVSQTSTSIAVYPQLSAKLAQIDDLIRKNPADPVGLTERGELRLDKGDWIGAVLDLATALRNKPPTEILERTREKFFESMCELARRDFSRAEEYLEEFKSACEVSPAPMSTETQAAEAKKETRRRKAAFMGLLAAGRESQGRLAEAFDAYVDVAATLGGSELLPVLEEPSLMAASDTWAQGRVSAMMAKAAPAKRSELEAKVSQRLEKAKAANTPVDELRGLSTVFGHLSSSGQEIRLLLAARLASEGSADAMTLAEQQLELVRPPLATPEQHARSLVELAKLNLSRQLPDDAAACLSTLALEYPDLLIDGKSGKARLAEAATDHRLLPFLDGPGHSFPAGRIKVVDKPGGGRNLMAHSLAANGKMLPFFSRHMVQFQFNQQTQGYNTLTLVDRATGEERMSESLARRNMLSTALNNSNYINPFMNHPRFSYQAVGHIMLASAGNVVYAIDPLRRRVLWDMNLNQPGEPASASSSPINGRLEMDGLKVDFVHPDGYRQRMGQAGPLLAHAAILLTKDGMMAVDPVTGRTLWVRQDIPSDSQVFSDGLTLAVASLDPASGKPSAVRGIRVVDGASVPIPDSSTLLANKIRISGSMVLWIDESMNGRKLKLTEAVSLRDIWTRDLPAESAVIQCEGESFTGFIEADGTLRLVDLGTGKETMVTKVDPRHAKDASPFAVSDGAKVFVGLHRQPDAAAQVQSAFIPASGINCRQLNGELYVFDKATGKLSWRTQCNQQSIVTEAIALVPVVVMASRSNRPIPNNPNGRMLQTTIRSFDKRTGKLLYEKESPGQQPLWSIGIDIRKGTIDLVSPQNTISHQVTDEPAQGAPAIRDQALPGRGNAP